MPVGRVNLPVRVESWGDWEHQNLGWGGVGIVPRPCSLGYHPVHSFKLAAQQIHSISVLLLKQHFFHTKEAKICSQLDSETAGKT